VVGVAGRGVGPGEQILVRPRQAGELAHPPGEGGEVHGVVGHAQTPQRSAGVRTGASHSRSRSSSSRSRVTEQPAISRLVMYGPTSDRTTDTPALTSICVTSWYSRYSSSRGVAPMPLTN